MSETKHILGLASLLLCSFGASTPGFSSCGAFQIIDDTGYGSGALNYDLSNCVGSGNTAFGSNALNMTQNVSENSGFGGYALYYNTTGSSNTATGYASLYENTTGMNNTAVGNYAMAQNDQGSNNTAVGMNALGGTREGSYNTAVGLSALDNNTNGNRNTGLGYEALLNNTADDNSAVGFLSLSSNTTGTLNNAVGNATLRNNTTGNNNNAVGYAALYYNTTGSNNNAQGFWALENNTTGSNNLALGQFAGAYQTTGSNNVYIASYGVAGESGSVRIGNTGVQTSFYASGISGVNVTGGASVVINSSGQLGVASSSRRFKEDIKPIGDASARLYQLQPVTFRYKQADDKGKKPIQYGLIAEDVAKVMPELVVYDREGRPSTVAYQTLTSLLLNELQKTRRTEEKQAAALRKQAAEISEMRGALSALSEQAKALVVERAASLVAAK